jgi:hypothetical protein
MAKQKTSPSSQQPDRLGTGKPDELPSRAGKVAWVNEIRTAIMVSLARLG